METALSQNLITHAVIMFGDIHHLIGNQTKEMLEQAGLNDLVELDDGSQIKPSGIMEIMPIDKYWDTFPEKKFYTYGEPPKDESYFTADTPQVKKETLDKLREKWGKK